MSSKVSILLTTDNEHWYIEGQDESIVLEIDISHSLKTYDETMKIKIKKGTPLHKELMGMIKKIPR